MYSVAAGPPCQKKITPVKATPMLIHTADSMAACLVVGAWGRRWTISRSPMSRVVTKARNVIQTQTGTWKLAKLCSADDDATTGRERTTSYLRLCHMDFQPKVSPATRAVVTGPLGVPASWPS